MIRLLFIITASLLITGCDDLRPKPAAPVTEQKEPPVKANEGVIITAVGDMMLGSDFPDRRRMPRRNILAPLTDSLRSGDFLIGNLEGVITSVPVPEKKCINPKNCYAFRMPPGSEHYFKEAGFDFLSLANNHSGDFGNAGLAQTMQLLEKSGIGFAGIKHHQAHRIIHKNGIRYGVIAAGFGWRHLHIGHPEQTTALIRRIKDSTDLLIVYFHGGAEGDGMDRVLKRKELFHGEDRGDMHAFARACVDAGADLVLGSGPHVARGLELYRNKLIAYSLGNYATYGPISLKGSLGMAPILKVRMNRNGDFAGGRIISTIQLPGNDQTPRLDSAETVAVRMQQLSLKDFPKSPLRITQKGEIIIKKF
ncbi:CapA family protein [Niabella pedocola]|uniref:CapA family protein n=1 Tax=Niabella pedocola TaxID=1752077 RepID=A0ABS8PTB6_9BACT|nr:CapA family protein [Niabella pedocola]MCD2424310.1 CapA family protein [Niabella pedocola]